MIQTQIAYTSEIDDIEDAVAAIKAQLNLDTGLLTHTIGILACHYDFVFSGAAKAICEALPFDTVGVVTVAQGVPATVDGGFLTLMVLTSDDTTFTAALTPPLPEDPCAFIEKTYMEAAAKKEGRPALIMPYVPIIVGHIGDDYVNTLSRVSGGVPTFGTLGIDDTEAVDKGFLLFNGEAYADRLAMVLVYTETQPKFYRASLSPDKIKQIRSVITKSDGNILMEINGRPVGEFFESIGMHSTVNSQYTMVTLPFILDFNDGTPPISRIFITRTPEGYAVSTGLVPTGATIDVGVFDKEDVLLTAGDAIKTILEEAEGRSCVLIYSCMARSFSLGGDPLGEAELVRDMIGDRIPFMLAYSGGEMCPTEIKADETINRYHSNTFIACMF